jgi:FtsX-like permease family protein
MNLWLQDLRLAFRLLRKNVVLTLVILASLGIGIGANSAIFSVVDALLLRPLPYPHPDRLAAVGIVLALGARPANFIGLVIRQGMQLTLIGILAGLTGAAVLTRVIASLLFGVSTTDVATFLAVPVLLAAVAFAATVIPALRATSVDPLVALREE